MVKNKKENAASVQQYLKIADIKDNILQLKDGGIRAVLEVLPLNFNLKSEDEQKGILYGYQEFLNTLEFPIQITVKSKKLDIDTYLDKMTELYKNQTSDLLRNLTGNYIEYITKLVEVADIMQKEFYITIPADPIQISKGLNPLSKFLKALNPMDSIIELRKRNTEFESLKKKMAQRVQSITNGLANIGLKTQRLDTYQLIELFYKSYNPDLVDTQKLKKLDEIDVPIEKGKVVKDEEE